MGFRDFLKEPDLKLDKIFCEKYKELAEWYWSLGDEDSINAIEAALDEVLRNLYGAKDLGAFSGMSAEQIKTEFEKRRILVFQQIPSVYASKIEKQINKHLLDNQERAKRCNMIIPQRNGTLTVSQYYGNYMLAIEYLRKLEILLGMKGKNK